jgi:hypothetical protein
MQGPRQGEQDETLSDTDGEAGSAGRHRFAASADRKPLDKTSHAGENPSQPPPASIAMIRRNHSHYFHPEKGTHHGDESWSMDRSQTGHEVAAG